MSAPLPELVKLMVQQNKLPRYLYKYRNTDDKYFPDIIENHRLRFSPVADFNDPFDGHLKLETECTNDERDEWLKKQGVDNDPKLKAAAEVYFKDSDKLWERINVNRQKIIDSWGVLCLSTEFDNSLLWSHYANSNRGVCLKFDVLADPDFFAIPMLVDYRKDYPKYYYFKKHSGPIDPLGQIVLATKSLDWTYEKEFRILKKQKAAELVQFKPSALVGVIFGTKASTKSINDVTQLLSISGFGHVTRSQLSLKERCFGFDVNNL